MGGGLLRQADNLFEVKKIAHIVEGFNCRSLSTERAKKRNPFS
jgi:hypothetical protein